MGTRLYTCTHKHTCTYTRVRAAGLPKRGVPPEPRALGCSNFSGCASQEERWCLPAADVLISSMVLWEQRGGVHLEGALTGSVGACLQTNALYFGRNEAENGKSTCAGLTQGSADFSRDAGNLSAGPM